MQDICILHVFTHICACFAAPAAFPAPTHPSIKEAALRAASTQGAGGFAARPLCGFLYGWMSGGWESSRCGNT